MSMVHWLRFGETIHHKVGTVWSSGAINGISNDVIRCTHDGQQQIDELNEHFLKTAVPSGWLIKF